jgi:hypothetical protein
MREHKEAEHKKLVDAVIRELEARWAERNPGKPRPPQEGDEYEAQDEAEDDGEDWP